MANANYAPTVPGTVLTGTSADDTISIDPTGAGGAVSVNAGGGIDTIIFDGELAAGAAAGVFAATGINVFDYSAATATFTVGAYEFLTFDNGTVSSNASVTPEQILADSISASITELGGDADAVPGVGISAPVDFDLSTILDWDGSNATTNAGAWTIQSIEGQTSTAGANVSIVEGGEIQGRVAVNATNDGIDVTAENAFHSSITEIGATKTMEIDVVLTDGTNTFAETLSVDVVGVASNADNTYAGTDGDDGTAAAPIDGLGGDDILRGGAGDDVIFGNDGNDQIWAGANDGPGTVALSTGMDTFVGGDGDDIIGGGAGMDTLIGDSHIGLVYNYGVNTDEGSNTLYGGADDDWIVVGGYDNAGTDFSAIAGDAAFMTGTVGGVAWGGTGDDIIFSTLSGDDVLGGGEGNDTIYTLQGDSVVYAGAGGDTITGDAATGGNTTIYGGVGDDTINAGSGNDVIFNGAGTDAVNGGLGNDTLWGGAGDDTFTGAGGVDTFAFTVGNGADTITDFTDGVDMIDLSELGITSLSDLVVEDQGAGNAFVIFYGESDSISLTGLGGTGNITDADFIF